MASTDTHGAEYEKDVWIQKDWISGVNLGAVNWSGHKSPGANLANCGMVDAKLDGCELTDANFGGCVLS